LFAAPESRLYTVKDIKKVTQEIQLSGSLLDNLEWRLGGFYTSEDNFQQQIVTAYAPSPPTDVGIIFGGRTRLSYKEYAGFADATYHFTDRLDVQVGGRLTYTQQSSRGVDLGVLPFGSIPYVKVKYDDANYLVAPRYRISE